MIYRYHPDELQNTASDLLDLLQESGQLMRFALPRCDTTDNLPGQQYIGCYAFTYPHTESAFVLALVGMGTLEFTSDFLLDPDESEPLRLVAAGIHDIFIARRVSALIHAMRGLASARR